MKNVFRRTLGTTSARGRVSSVRGNKGAAFVPRLTCLEDRLVPAPVVNFHMHNGELYFYGTEGKDEVIIIYNGAQGSGYQLQISIKPCMSNGDSCFWYPDKNLVTQKNAHFFGYGGDDYFSGNAGADIVNPINPIKAYAYGMAGDDLMYGGPGKDFLNGGAGADRLYGDKESDRLLGEDGNDKLEGQDGDDVVYGAFDGYIGDLAGGDTLRGGNGNDILYGGGGNDFVDGGYGTDHVYGEDGNDSLYAGYDSSWNVVDGGNGVDGLYGGYGWDYLYGGNDNDWLYGNSGTDIMHGGNGSDYLYGQAGDDDLNGGEDNQVDYLYGGAGVDWFKFNWIDYYPDINAEDEVYT